MISSAGVTSNAGLYTSTFPGTVTRPKKFLISSALLGVLAQRLIRKLCPHCKTPDTLVASYAQDFDIAKGTQIYKAVGCQECKFSGYKSRIAIGELFIMTDKIKEYLKNEVDDTFLLNLAREEGMVSIKDQVRKLLIKGDTSLDEAIRIGLK